MRKLLILIALLLSVLNSFSQSTLEFNEVQQSNLDFYDDNYFLPDGWVELYNPSDEVLDIVGYSISLSDDINAAYKITTTYNKKASSDTDWYVKPSSKIPAKGFILIYLDELSGGLHTPFKLDIEEDNTLYLFSPEGELVDKIKVPKMPVHGLSYGKKAEGADAWCWQNEPTPNAINNSPAKPLPITPEIVFSVKGGVFYGDTLSIELSTTRVDFEYPIYYTLDGTEPTKEDSLYKEPFVIDSTIVIRAKVIHENYLSRPSNVQSYIFPDHEITLPVVSLVCDERVLFDDTIGIYVTGVRPTAVCWSKPGNYGGDRERFLTFQYLVDNKEVINQDINIKISGGCTRTYSHKSISLKAKKRLGESKLKYSFFKEKPNVTKYKDLVLRTSGNDYNRTLYKDAFIQKLLGGKVNLDYQEYQPTVVYLNGRYWGLFNLRERTNEHTVESIYGINSDSVDFIENWENIKNGSLGTLPAVIDTIMQNPTGDAKIFTRNFDLDETLNYLSLATFVIHIDFPINNVFMWRKDGYNDGNWRFYAKDYDVTTSYSNLTDPDQKYLDFLVGKNTIKGWAWTEKRGAVFKYLITQDSLKHLFINRVMLHTGTFFEESNSMALFDSLSYNIESEVPYHNQVWGTLDNWEKNKDVVRNFFSERYHTIYSEMQEFYNLGEIKLLEVGTELENVQLNMYGQPIYKNTYKGKCFAGRPVLLESNNSSSTWKISYTNLLTGEQESFIQPNSVYNLVVSENWENVVCENICESVDLDEALSDALVNYLEGVLTIKSNSEIKNLAIYNISGSQLYSKKDINSTDFSELIDLENIVILKIETTSQTSVLKLRKRSL